MTDAHLRQEARLRYDKTSRRAIDLGMTTDLTLRLRDYVIAAGASYAEAFQRLAEVFNPDDLTDPAAIEPSRHELEGGL